MTNSKKIKLDFTNDPLILDYLKELYLNFMLEHDCHLTFPRFLIHVLEVGMQDNYFNSFKK